MRDLCRKIGSNYGEYFEEKNQLCIDNGHTVFRYNTEKELLTDWIHTLIEESLSGGFDWSDEIEDIVLNYNHKVRGVCVYKGKKGVTYMATIDLPKGNGKTMMRSCGTYNTIVEAIKARKRAEEHRKCL